MHYVPLILCCAWDHIEDGARALQSPSARRLCPEIEVLSLQPTDQRNIVPYFMRFRQPRRLFFRYSRSAEHGVETICMEPTEPVIPLCINGAPGFTDSVRGTHVRPVIYGPHRNDFHRDFALAIGEYFSTYIFMYATYLEELDERRLFEETTRFEFFLTCPTGSEAVAWFFTDAVNLSAKSRADTFVYREYEAQIFGHARAKNKRSIWNVCTEKSAELFTYAYRSAVQNLRQKGHFRALTLLERSSFEFRSVDGRPCPCDSSRLAELLSRERPRRIGDNAVPQGQPALQLPRSDRMPSSRSCGSQPVKKFYHDKTVDSDSSDDDEQLESRYKVCRYSTHKHCAPIYGPCVTSREVEDNVPPGICWGHWRRFHQGRNSDPLDNSGKEGEGSSSRFCAVM